MGAEQSWTTPEELAAQPRRCPDRPATEENRAHLQNDNRRLATRSPARKAVRKKTGCLSFFSPRNRSIKPLAVTTSKLRPGGHKPDNWNNRQNFPRSCREK